MKFQTKARRFLFHVSARRFESIGVAARKMIFENYSIDFLFFSY
jgi:hypothetical protein